MTALAPAAALEGRVAIVTGGAGLLGRQHAQALLDAGARVVLTDLHQHEIDEAAQSIAPTGDRDVLTIAGDVTNADDVRAVRDAAVLAWGRIDVLVNNAAINDRFESPELAASESRLECYPLERWRRMLEVNVTGVYLPTQVIGCAMTAAGRGSIINVASTYGLVAPDPSLYVRPDGSVPFVKSPAYPASKGAVLALTRFVAAYWGRAGVRVNALVPGGVENGQEPYFIESYARRTPLGRMAAPADYRGAVVFLASDASAYMTGAALVIDGGYTAW